MRIPSHPDPDDWFEQERLHQAAADGDLAEVQRLIALGYDVNAFDDCTDLIPLHHAAEHDHYSVMACLLAAGAEINAHREERIANTPLRHVIKTCSAKMAQFLVSCGADPLIPGWMQLTPLVLATQRQDPEGLRVYEILVSVEANASSRGSLEP